MPTTATVSNSASKTKRRTRKKGDAAWLEKRRVKCANYAEENAVLVKRGFFLMCWAIVADVTGSEAERHLRSLDRLFVERVYRAAWGIDEGGVALRDWTHWRARAVAAVCVFLAYNCMPAELHGRKVWRVAGFTMNFFRMLVSLHVLRDGEYGRTMPSRSTFGHVSQKQDSDAEPRGWMGDLVHVGLVEAHQFDADKVGKHLRGPMKKDGTQFAFNQWFLLIRPFAPGFDGPKPLEKKEKNKPKFRVRRIAESLMQRLKRKKREEDAAEEQRLLQEAAVMRGVLGPLDAPDASGGVQAQPDESSDSEPAGLSPELARIIKGAEVAYSGWAKWERQPKPPD